MALAPYAVTDSVSRGRQVAENKPADGRTEFQRDRDRVIHSSAFSRLQGKTQVFTRASERFGQGEEGVRFSDHLRNRLTHSIEVSQVSRTLARRFKLNEDLVETLALAHDFGHPPFGHTGQDVLNECMSSYGGFEHNIQSLRIVDKLEHKYPRFEGLNLMFETREGLIKHCSLNNARKLGPVAERILNKQAATLEGQCTDLGDAIAYSCHDIDDGIRSRLITPESMMEVSVFAQAWEGVGREYPGLDSTLHLQQTLRDVLGLFVRGIIRQSSDNIADARLTCLADVRTAGSLIALPDGLAEEHKRLKSHLYHTVYMHPSVSSVRKDAHTVLNSLFTAYMNDAELIPQSSRQGLLAHESDELRARVVVDYISGMTDSFAYQAALDLKKSAPALEMLL